MVRSPGVSATGVALPPSDVAQLGVAQISAIFPGQAMLNEPAPHINSKRGLYGASESLYVMQAVSGLPISAGSTGGNCDCSPSALLSLYPVARESQKFPPTKLPCSASYWSGGK